MPSLIGWGNRSRYNLLLRSSGAGYLLILCFLFSFVATMLNINVVFGAFLAGICLGLQGDQVLAKEKSEIKSVALGLFIPMYFALVGAQLDLLHHWDPQFFIWFFAVACALPMVGTLLGAWTIGLPWREGLNFAVAMSTKGGPGIVLATVAYNLGIINDTFFVTLVLLAILTSLVCGIWFRLQQQSP